MRILFISAFYPPHVIGGWEQLTQDINLSLEQRGHISQVLTSDYGVSGAAEPEPGIDRSLRLESDLDHYRMADFFIGRRSRLAHNLERTAGAIRSFRPDVAFIHGMYNLSRAVAWQAEQMLPGRVLYYLASDWPWAPSAHRQFWTEPAARPGRRLAKRLLAPLALRVVAWEERRFPLRFARVLCVSRAVRQGMIDHLDIPASNLEVVHNGVEVDRFIPAVGWNGTRSELRMLVAGNIAEHKGVHTAVEAIAMLSRQGQAKDLSLSILGSGHPAYRQRLERMVAMHDLQEHVCFLPRVDREQMPAVLQNFDVLVFPSTWEEPLARTMQEAMAAGLVVIGTPTGGTPELLEDGVTGLSFPPGDAQGLANQILRLRHDPALRQRLAHDARQVVVDRFNMERMVAAIEAALELIAGSRDRSAGWGAG